MRERCFSLEGVGEGGGDTLGLLAGSLCWSAYPFPQVAREGGFYEVVLRVRPAHQIK